MALAVGLSSVNLADAWLNGLRNVAFQKAAIYAKLHTAIPGSAGTASAATNDATRKQVTFAASSGGAIAKDATEVKWTSGADFSEAVSHVSMWDDPTAGNFLWSFVLGTPKTWTTTGDTLTLTACGLSLTPIATT
jgi:hypothetical protein